MLPLPLPEAIVFLNPPYRHLIQRKWRCSPQRSGYVFPPLELLSLASLPLSGDGLERVFIDAIAQKLTADAVVKRLEKYRVRIMVFMPGFESFEQDLKTVSKIREHLDRDCRIISFGFLPSLYYTNILQKFPSINYILVGEPEKPFAELIRALLSHDIDIKAVQGVAFNDGTKVILNKKKDGPLDLETLPFPDRRLLRNDLYADPFLKKPMTSVVTSRGCPHPCTFCVNFDGRGFRQRSAQHVLRELKEIITGFHIRDVRFMDDNFTVNKKRLIEICRGIIDGHWGLSWTCLSRVDTLDEETLAWMSEAGCKAIFLGIESGSQKVLDHYGKGYTVDLIKEKCRLIKRSGIETVAWFMIGAPVERVDDVRASLKLALEIDPDFICINELQLMPTTKIFSDLKDRVRVSVFPFKVDHPPFYLSEREVARLRGWFYASFYFSPKIIWKMFLRLVKEPERLFFFLKEFISATRLKYVEK